MTVKFPPVLMNEIPVDIAELVKPLRGGPERDPMLSAPISPWQQKSAVGAATIDENLQRFQHMATHIPVGIIDHGEVQ